MKFEMLTLCDGAYNYNGHLTIIGTYDNIKAEKFPWQSDFAFAMKLLVPKEESGIKKITIKFLDPEGNTFASDMNAEVKVPKTNSNGHVVFTSEIRGLLFKMAGTYSLLIEENEEKLKEFAFDVIGG